jgi:hypothetical protein
VNFEEYLTSKKIDSAAFKSAEESLWLAWKEEFEQLHPNSFTLQKLNLINPIRRKYQLKIEVPAKVVIEKTSAPVPSSDSQATAATSTDTASTPLPKPAVPRPVFKPKPKLN